MMLLHQTEIIWLLHQRVKQLRKAALKSNSPKLRPPQRDFIPKKYLPRAVKPVLPEPPEPPVIKMFVKEVGHGMFSAEVNGEIVVKASHTPFFATARVLRERGVGLNEIIVMMRDNAWVSLRSTVGQAARFSIQEGNSRPRLTQWEKFSMERQL